MYAALWRRLPGPTAVKAALAGALLAAVLAVLLLVVFPRLHPGAPYDSEDTGGGVEQEQVVEPDGVRPSGAPTGQAGQDQPDPAGSPVVPEDTSVPQL